MAVTYDDLIFWAVNFFPEFRYSKGPGGVAERFYPVDVEGWLRHDANTEQEQTFRRGTAVYRWRTPHRSVTSSGSNGWLLNPPDISPGAITLDAHPETGIGAARFTTQPPSNPRDDKSPPKGDWYLDFSGWNHPSDRRHGRLRYAYKLYASALAQAGVSIGEEPTEPDGRREDLTSAAPVVPPRDDRALHAYAEIGEMKDIIGELINVPISEDLDTVSQQRDALRGKAADLANYYGITYYLFYPVYEPPDRNKVMEGQWEAVTVFGQIQPSGYLSKRYAAYTQGYDNRTMATSVWPRPLASARLEREIEWSARGPVVYVAWGSHANYFTPRGEASNEPRVDWGGLILGGGMIAVAALIALVGAVLLVVGVACLVGTLDLAVPCWVPTVVGAGLLILAAALALAGFATIIISAINSQAEPLPYDDEPRNDQHAGDGDSMPADNTIGTPDAGASGSGLQFVVHPIARIRGDEDQPRIDDPRSLPPSWWDYAGRWGVCVNDEEARTELKEGDVGWSNGTYRRRPDGYTLTHRNLEALLDYVHGEIDREYDSTTLYDPN